MVSPVQLRMRAPERNKMGFGLFIGLLILSAAIWFSTIDVVIAINQLTDTVSSLREKDIDADMDSKEKAVDTLDPTDQFPEDYMEAR